MYFYIVTKKIKLAFSLQKFEEVFHFEKKEVVFYLKMECTTRLCLSMLQMKLRRFPTYSGLFQTGKQEPGGLENKNNFAHLSWNWG